MQRVLCEQAGVGTTVLNWDRLRWAILQPPRGDFVIR